MLRLHPGLFEGRHLAGEGIEPGHELRTGGAPSAFEPQVEITQSTGLGDMTDVENVRQIREMGFRMVEDPGDLSGLELDPFLFVPVGGAVAALIDLQE